MLTIYADNKAKLDMAIALSRKLKPVAIEGMILDKLPYLSTFTERSFCPVPPKPQGE